MAIKIKTNAVGQDARLLEVMCPAVDASTGTAQNGPGVVGTVIGTDGTAQTPLKFDGGTAVYESIGTMAKLIPTVIWNPYVYLNAQGTPQHVPRFVAVCIPHTAINGDAGGTIGDNITLYTDGGPDVQPPVTVTGRNIGMWCGDDLVIGQNLFIGEDGNVSTFMEWKAGSNAVNAPANYARQRYNETKQSWEVSVDESQYRPWPLALNYFETHDPPTQTTYQPGETVIHSLTPASASAAYRGMRSIIPHRWTLPAATCGLVPGIRIVVNTGSAQLYQNGTASEVQVSRDSVYLALANSYVVEIRFVITNTTAEPVTADLGYFQFEGTFV